MEEKGTGVNKFTYYVTNDVFGNWSKLPDLSPQHIAAARQLKVLFTGDLERDIIANPFFFGKEKHYLRAQIARISCSTALAPAGAKKLDEENERNIVDNEPEEGELVLPNTSQMASLSAWVHEQPSILNCNRTVHVDPPEEGPEGVEEYDPEEEKKKIEAADPFEPRLKPITGDRGVAMACKSVKQVSWVVRLMGDQNEFADEKKPGGPTLSNGCVVVRSLIWPGSFTFYQN
jgi:radial spoke head protein 4/6